MKKIFYFLVVMLACVGLVTVASADAATPEGGDVDVSTAWTCAHCKSSVTWTVLPASIPTAAGHYHYYLTESVTPGQLLVNSGVSLCLDLKGHGIDVSGRAMIAYNGSIVSIMDSSAEGTGYMAGSDTRTNNVAGGTVTVQENAVLNLYSGTLKFKDTANGDSVVDYGGTVYLKTNSADKTKIAEMNMYGGRVEGGALASTSTKGGAAIYVNTDAVLNVYGGTITSGTIPATAVGKCVSLVTSTSKMNLCGDADVEEIYITDPANLTIIGEYTGKTRLLLRNTPSAGLAVGISDGATLSGDIFCVNGDGWLVEENGENLILAAFTPTAERHFCQHCQDIVKWSKLTSTACTALKTTAGEYHYYLANTFNRTQQIYIAPDAQVCLDLNGNDLISTQRAFYVYADGQLRIMDTKGGGEVVGATSTTNPTGGVMVIKEGAVVELYGGTVRLNASYKAGYGVGVGGVVYMSESGTLNVHGGTIQGADLVMSEYGLTINGKGAAVYMSSSARLNVSGGQITAGTLAEGCEGESVYLNSSTATVTVSGSGSVADVFCKYENDQLTISGAYSGVVNLTYPSTVTVSENMVVGVSDGADLTASTAGCGNQWMLAVSGDDLVLQPNATAVVISGGNTTAYDTLQEAVDKANGGIVKLMKPVTENITVSKETCLDLNGKTLDGTVTVSDGVTLYGMDSQTDDYTVKDIAGYGKLTVSGEGKVLGLPEESALTEHGYMMIAEADGISFHAVNLKLTAMTLRAEQAGVYYKSSFAGDELVAERVLKFGVALSVKNVPTVENLEKDCKLSEVSADFTAGGMDNDATSTLLKGVMKSTNGGLLNHRNAQLPIYGRAYILTEEGYMFGASACRSFQEQVEMTDDIWTNTSMTAEKKAAVVAMYEQYREVMKNWDIPNIIAQKDPGSDGVLKILGIGNSYTQDSMWMLYNIYKAENPDKEIVLGIAYYGGCSLAQHVNFISAESPEYTFYKMSDEIYAAKSTWQSTKEVTLKSIVENENWDIVTMQQASTYSGMPDTYNGDIQTIQKFVDKTLGYTPTFAWNMTWAYPVKDIEGDAFTTVNTTSGFASRYNSDQMTMFNAIVSTVKAKIVPDKTFSYLMPAGVAVQNANSSYLDDPDLYRDYTHLNDFSRVMAAYVWYCTFEEVQVDSLKFTVVPAGLTRSYKTAGGTGNMTLTQMQIDILEESVKNALDARDAGTFDITQSQYTVAP